MAYQVIARKWRPQDFQRLVGQNHISQTLLNSLSEDRIPHALLFTGPRGTGKTSTARILAKSLRCPNAKDYVPCNQCSECEDISAGRAVNVVEVDGASNNGVDAIRELRETVGYMPSEGRYKIYIIDEVHMLSTSAFNALLKTLEEPPEHVLFVMATTEVQKIPDTILSRCQRFDFRRIPTRLIAEKLKEICEAEGIKAQPEALWVVARQGDGSMRDSQSLLDQVVSFCRGNLKLDEVTNVLGLTDQGILREALSAVAHQDQDKMLQVISTLFETGHDPLIFMKDFLEGIRHLLLIKLNPKKSFDLIDLAPEEIEKLKEFTEPLSHEDLHLLFDMSLKGLQDLHRTQETRTVMEMLLLRVTQAPRIQNLKDLLSAKNTSTGRAPSQQTSSQVTKPAAPTTAAKDSFSSEDPWSQLVEKLKKINPLMAAKLEHVYVVEKTDKELTLGAPEKYRFLESQVTDPEFLKKLTNYITTFWGPGYQVDFKFEAASSSLTTSSPEEEKQKLSPKKRAEMKAKSDKEKVKAEVENHPLVRSTKKLFNTNITSIKENP